MLRPLVHFFLIGAVLLGGKALYEGRRTEHPEITVQVPAGATPAEVEKAIREAILLHEAKRYGWDRRDPVVFTHLVRNMRFIEPGSTDDDLTLYRRAIEMNMQEHDPVVRARLLYRAGEALSYVPADRMPSPEALRAHLEAHPKRFEREGRVRFQQVFLSRSKRGSSVSADAAELQEELAELGDAAPRGLGDPLLGLRAEQSAMISRIEDAYGTALASAVDEAPVGSWRGPISSVYGLHFVKVLERKPPHVPSFEVIEAEVRADRLREIRKELRRERMSALRKAYRVRVERVH